MVENLYPIILLKAVKVWEKYIIWQKRDTGNNNIAVAAGGKTSLNPSIGCLWWQPWRR